MSRVVVVLGASGTIGVGFVRVCLETKGMKVVPVFRTAESMEKTLAKLGNPSDSHFIPVVGSIATEAAGEELRKQIEQKAGPVTDVLNTVGGLGTPTGHIPSQSLENFEKMCFPEKLTPQFVAAKTFIPALASTPGATYTFINGPSGKDFVMRKFGNVCIGNRAQSRMCDVLMDEYRDKEIRINEFVINCFVAPLDSDAEDLPPGGCSNVAMGRAILGVLLHPAARGLSMMATPDNLEQITNTGVTEKVYDSYTAVDINI